MNSELSGVDAGVRPKPLAWAPKTHLVTPRLLAAASAAADRVAVQAIRILRVRRTDHRWPSLGLLVGLIHFPGTLTHPGRSGPSRPWPLVPRDSPLDLERMWHDHSSFRNTRLAAHPWAGGPCAYQSEGRFEIAAAIAMWAAVPGLFLKRFNVGDVVAPCFEGLPGNAPVRVVAAGV